MDASGSWPVPVEYAVAVDRYLDSARLAPASRRVYRISLNTWSWLLIDRTPPQGAERRRVQAPVVPLARLDGPHAAARLHTARERRALMVDERTLDREAAILRTALGWWAAHGWIGPLAGDGLRPRRVEAPSTLTDSSATDSSATDSSASEPAAIDVEAVFALRAPLREQTLWHLIFESAAPVEHVLALDAADLDLDARRVRRRIAPGPTEHIGWGDAAAALLPLLLVGRRVGPAFLTQRRAPTSTPASDRCPHSGHGRLSTRRAAELFRAATGPLDPTGRGWTLRDLRVAGRAARGIRVRRNGGRRRGTAD
jgi:integrase/recombinase XerD